MRIKYLLILLFLSGIVLSQPVSVTFQVDMSVQIEYGLFDTANDVVYLRGEFNDWDLNFPMTDDDVDTIYTFTIEGLMPADTFNYKYYRSNGETWEDDPERVLIVPDQDDTLEVAFFNRQDGSTLSADVLVAFNVNMEFEKIAGRFEPSSDTVWVRGAFNGWAGTHPMTPSVTDPNIYEGQADLFLFEGDTIHYKFAYGTSNDITWENDFTQNTGGHRLIGITTDILNAGFVLDEGVFNEISLDDVTNYESSVVFSVDMNNAVDLNGNSFSAIENVFVCGGTYPLGWGWEQNQYDNAIFMNDNGEEGDETAGDGVWSVRVFFPQYTPLSVQYKYGANWGLSSNNGTNDNENPSGEDHWIELVPVMVSAKVENVFGEATTSDNPHPLLDVVTDIEETNTVATGFSLDQNYPNPFNPTTTISFSVSQAGFVTLKVYDILGNEISALVAGQLNAGEYKVGFSGAALSSGVYFYELRTQNSVATNKMILIK